LVELGAPELVLLHEVEQLAIELGAPELLDEEEQKQIGEIWTPLGEDGKDLSGDIIGTPPPASELVRHLVRDPQ
jgi:hypothetical protein